jgi:hypothetical protein
MEWLAGLWVSFKTLIFKMCVLVNVCAAPQAPVSPLTFGEFGRLVSDTTKVEVACPTQTARTMVAFVMGQSNAANHSSHITTASNPRILNYFNGKCYLASDPLLGATGPTGSQWVAMGQKLLSRYDKIILIPFAISGVSVTRFTGDLNPSFVATMAQVKMTYNVTHFLWHQGENDAMYPIGKSAYTANLNTLIKQAKAKFPAARFYTSIVTICDALPNPAIQAAQKSAVNPRRGIFLGVNSDSLGDLYRYDRCHFNEAGIDALSTMWAAIL